MRSSCCSCHHFDRALLLASTVNRVPAAWAKSLTSHTAAWASSSYTAYLTTLSPSRVAHHLCVLAVALRSTHNTYLCALADGGVILVNWKSTYEVWTVERGAHNNTVRLKSVHSTYLGAGQNGIIQVDSSLLSDGLAEFRWADDTLQALSDGRFLSAFEDNSARLMGHTLDWEKWTIELA